MGPHSTPKGCLAAPPRSYLGYKSLDANGLRLAQLLTLVDKGTANRNREKAGASILDVVHKNISFFRIVAQGSAVLPSPPAATGLPLGHDHFHWLILRVGDVDLCLPG